MEKQEVVAAGLIPRPWAIVTIAILASKLSWVSFIGVGFRSNVVNKALSNLILVFHLVSTGRALDLLYEHYSQ